MEESTQSDNLIIFLAWFEAHKKQVVAGVAIAAVAIGGLTIYNWNQERTEIHASEALLALPTGMGAAKIPANAEAFSSLAQEYAKTEAGQRAALLAASTLFDTGKYSEAQTRFEKFLTDYSGSQLIAQAAFGIASALEAQGKTAEAISKYEEIAKKYSTENVAPQAKLALARILESTKPEEALKYYDSLIQPANPYDAWGAEATQRREALLIVHPNLVKPVALVTPAVSSLVPSAPVKTPVVEAPKAK